MSWMKGEREKMRALEKLGNGGTLSKDVWKEGSVPKPARQPQMEEVTDMRVRFSKDLEQLRERVATDSATVKQKLSWRHLLEETPETGFKRTHKQPNTLNAEAAEAFGRSPSDETRGSPGWVETLRALWARRLDSPEEPSLVRNVVALLRSKHGIMRGGGGKEGGGITTGAALFWATLVLVLLALGLSHHHHVTVQFGVANYSPDADDADVMGRVVASSSESSSSAFERTLPAEATPRTMVQMMMAPEVETPQPVAEGDAQGLLAGGTHGGGLFGGKSKSSRARSTSSRKDGGRMDRMEVDKYMSSTMEDKISKLRDSLLKDLLAKRPKSSSSSSHSGKSTNEKSKSSSHSSSSKKDSKSKSSSKHGRRLLDRAE